MSKTEQLVTKDFFTGLPFWGDLERTEQSTVEKETRGLAAAHAGQVVSRIAIGEHLTNLQAVLDGKKLFRPYLETLNFSYRTAYRYMEAYRAVKDRLPEYALRLAAARGMDLVSFGPGGVVRPFGAYTEAIKKLPPPADPQDVPEWLNKVEEARKAVPKGGTRHKRTVAPDGALKGAFRAVTSQYKRLPGGKTRNQWAVKLLGILMAEFGLPAQTVQPEAVPEGFRAVLGRPKEKKERGERGAREDGAA